MIDDIASFALSGPDAIKTNAIINSKIESKKLKFGPSKCHNIHFGKIQDTDSMLKVDSNIMNVKDYETYLGDIICKTGSNQKNIENRTHQGLAAINQITSMLSLTSLGHFYFEMSLVFRDSVLLSKLVFNSEVWYNVTNAQLEKLEQIDELYLRKMFSVAKTAPKVGLFIECGKLPVKIVIKMRRIMYYWQILHKDEDELLSKFFTVQKYSPSEGDWVCQVQKDMSDIKLDLSEAVIKSLSQFQFRNLVRKKIDIFAIDYLKSKRKTKSMKLDIVKLEPKNYLLSKNLSITEVQTLYKVRNSMIDVKENFKSSHEDNMWCKTCLLFTETQQHLIDCPKIREKLRGLVKFSNLSIDMAFQSLKNQEEFARSYNMVINARSDIISQGSGDQ